MQITLCATSTTVAPFQEIIPPFDYGNTSQDIVQDIEAAAKEFRDSEDNLRKVTMEYAVKQGKLLLDAKQKVGHGRFAKWIHSRLGVSDQTARNFMGAATLASKSQTVLDLPVAIVYKLAAPNTPPELRQEIIEKLESGEKPKPHEIGTEIKAAKEKIAEDKAKAAKAKREAEKLAKKTAGKSKEEAEKITNQQAAYQKKVEAAAAKKAASDKAADDAEEKAATDAIAMIPNSDLFAFAELIEITGGGRFAFTLKKAVAQKKAGAAHVG